MSVHEVNKPMMADNEIEIIDKILSDLKPRYCLEWGSGASTVYFPTNCPSIELWLAVEHNGHFLDSIQDKCPDSVQTLWVLPGSSYSDVVQRSNRKFDFILIDGLDRPKCLENAMKIVSDDGVILLHDAGRKEHTDLIEEFKGERLSEGEKPVQDGGFAHRGLVMFRRQHGAS